MAKTPGVYINEKNAFPNTVVPVASAVPAFIGYTEKAIRGKKDLTNVPTRIGSLREYVLYFGAAYYSWLETSITSSKEVSFENIQAGAIDKLIDILNEETSKSLQSGLFNEEHAKQLTEKVNALKEIQDTPAEDLVVQTNTKELHQALFAMHPLYKSIVDSITKRLNLLPPSGGMAGIYTMVDNNMGVFQSSANVSMGLVVGPSVNISGNEQDDLNVPLDGKAINAIRTFPGKGALVWGARTLDGNSLDWRYISVRRTVIMIEQSVKNAAQAYVFEPNTASTWSNPNAMLSNFLTNVWASGGLVGATPENAFSVDVGLGATMTSTDSLEGINHADLHKTGRNATR